MAQSAIIITQKIDMRKLERIHANLVAIYDNIAAIKKEDSNFDIKKYILN